MHINVIDELIDSPMMADSYKDKLRQISEYISVLENQFNPVRNKKFKVTPSEELGERYGYRIEFENSYELEHAAEVARTIWGRAQRYDRYVDGYSNWQFHWHGVKKTALVVNEKWQIGVIAKELYDWHKVYVSPTAPYESVRNFVDELVPDTAFYVQCGGWVAFQNHKDAMVCELRFG